MKKILDNIVFDVFHQCYTHKLLTGRKEAYLDPNQYADVSGFTNPEESEHDMFAIGHASTAISLACGLAKARDVRGGDGNVIAVVGDGALSGGTASCNLFHALGFDYRFIPDGNNLEQLLAVFGDVKDINHPVVVHMCTVKGKGYRFAEAEKENWHYRKPYD